MRRLAAEGRAPVIAGLLDRAAQGSTSPPAGLYEGALWPTLFTARSASRHGYYCHEELSVGRYDHRDTSPSEVVGTPFWDALGRSGKRVAVIDVPHSTASGPVNGIQIVEWGCHDRHLGFHTWPPSLAGEVERRFGLHPVGGIDAYSHRQFAPCDWAHRAGAPRRARAEARALFADLMAGLDRKIELSLHYLDQGLWDLFVTVFGEAHCAGHQFWFLHDSTHPAHDPELAREIGDPVARIYSRIDEAVGAHLERAGRDTTVFVLLSHGMGHMNSGVFLIDGVLRRLAEAERSGRRGRPVRAVTAVWDGLPVGVRRRLAPAVARLVRRRLRNSHDGLAAYQELFDRCPGCSAALLPADYTSPWFVVPNNTVVGGIRINLAGREPHGVVERGAEFDSVCERLATDLLDIVKVETGEPLVRRVTRTSEHFDRPERDAFPDLLVEWDRRSPTKTVYSPKIGVVHEPYDHWRTGDHFPDGLLLATGPGIPPRAMLPTVPMSDIAPTICARLGVQLSDVDGRPVPDLSAAMVSR
jgi:predicted AlkP superfamily phosphohydrolase/phosphomutase